jgi:hypothetical protein
MAHGQDRQVGLVLAVHRRQHVDERLVVEQLGGVAGGEPGA